jgi:hypothetical protein
VVVAQGGYRAQIGTNAGYLATELIHSRPGR